MTAVLRRASNGGEGPATTAAPVEGPRATRLLVAMCRAYQTVRFGHPSPCRFVPSCSQYAIEALQRHGARRGSWLTIRRVSRCHPWGAHGADPVPD